MGSLLWLPRAWNPFARNVLRFLRSEHWNNYLCLLKRPESYPNWNYGEKRHYGEKRKGSKRTYQPSLNSIRFYSNESPLKLQTNQNQKIYQNLFMICRGRVLNTKKQEMLRNKIRNLSRYLCSTSLLVLKQVSYIGKQMRGKKQIRDGKSEYSSANIVSTYVRRNSGNKRLVLHNA